MDGRIGRLRCRYRVYASREAAGGLVSRLELRAAEDLERACSDALEQALGDDPAVYVLRRVNSRVVIGCVEESEDRQISRWGEQLAGAVVRTIARDPGNAENLIRFADQAEYVARFVEDTLDGTAWDHWYFGAFSKLQPYSRQDILRRVLLDHEEHLTAILAALAERRALDRMLAALDADTLALIWARARRAGLALDPDGARSLFAEAMRIAGALQLWRGTRPEPESLFQAYVAYGAEAPDWRSRAGLAEGVMQALRFMASRSLLRVPETTERSLRQEIDGTVSALDWLDAQWLGDRLMELLRTALPETYLPARPRTESATPRQRTFLAALARLIHERKVSLDRSAPDSHANALRVYAVLVSAEPDWSDDPLALDLIGKTLAAWAAAERKREEGSRIKAPISPAEAGQEMRTQSPGGGRERDLDSFVDALGEPAREVIAALLASDTAAAADLEWIDTECAGVFLLLRTCLDLRLPAIAANARYPSRDDTAWRILLISIGLKLRGEAGVQDGLIDGGLLAMSGCEEPLTVRDIADTWSRTTPEDHARFESLLLDRMVRLRLADPSAESLDQLKHMRAEEPARTFTYRVPGADAVADRALGRISASIVRAWAFWLPRLAQSSLPYLMNNFLLRRGHVAICPGEIVVEMEPLPLDEILRLAGYLDDLGSISWLDNRRVSFRSRGR